MSKMLITAALGMLVLMSEPSTVDAQGVECRILTDAYVQCIRNAQTAEDVAICTRIRKRAQAKGCY